MFYQLNIGGNMKKPLVLASLLFVLLSNNIFGQSTKYGWLHQDSWNLGFGFTYPRYVSTNLNGEDIGNYGFFLSRHGRNGT